MRKHLALALAFALFLSPMVAWATSTQWTLPGTAITFADSGGTVTMAFSAKASGGGQTSALSDLGAGAHVSLFQAQCSISLTGTNVVGQGLEYYVVTSQDGATLDGGVTANAAWATSDKRRNLTWIGTLVVDQVTTNTTMIATFRNIYLPARYFALGFFNGSALPVETSTTKHKCVFTPMPIQMQNT